MEVGKVYETVRGYSPNATRCFYLGCHSQERRILKSPVCLVGGYSNGGLKNDIGYPSQKARWVSKARWVVEEDSPIGCQHPRRPGPSSPSAFFLVNDVAEGLAPPQASFLPDHHFSPVEHYLVLDNEFRFSKNQLSLQMRPLVKVLAAHVSLTQQKNWRLAEMKHDFPLFMLTKIGYESVQCDHLPAICFNGATFVQDCL